MEVYLEPIKIAFFTFPLLALLITLPYLIYQYHKFGSVPFLRSAIVYTFALYLLTAFFLVILPLPSRQAVALMPTKTPQLIPFHFIKDFMDNTNIVWKDPRSYLTLIKNPTVYTVLFNIVLTIPFGIYLRYYFEKKWSKVLLASFLLSLFFEVTQLTGLFGIYPKAYRLFDVDDLLMNTLGGMIGFWITSLLTCFLPSRKKLDETSYKKGQEVSIYRRIIAFFIDMGGYTLCFGIVSLLFPHWNQYPILFLLAFLIYYILIPIITNGYTIGKFVVKIRLAYKGKRGRIFFLILRECLLYLGTLLLPFYCLNLLEIDTNSIFMERLIHLIVLFFLIYYLTFLLQFFKSLVGKKRPFLYEKITKTENVSTIVINMELQEK